MIFASKSKINLSASDTFFSLRGHAEAGAHLGCIGADELMAAVLFVLNNNSNVLKY